MQEHLHFYIGGEWVAPVGEQVREVIDPSTEQPIARVAFGSAEDVDRAVRSARNAFEDWASRPLEYRLSLFDKIIEVYQKRAPDMAQAISREMGAPMWLATSAHVPAGLAHFVEARRLLGAYPFEQVLPSGARVLREAAGVCALITPWNWPANQVSCKVAPALAAGCTMVLKPSQYAPLDSLILAEILHEAGVPAGVFNLVNGAGSALGASLSTHPEVDLVSITGSNRAGVEVAKAAADTVKRVSLELGGKSANIILDDADLQKAVASGVVQMLSNAGQSCNAPSRMLVPRHLQEDAVEIAVKTMSSIKVMAPDVAEKGAMGPLANASQFATVQSYIELGQREGARLACGGVGRVDGFNKGFFARPTLFADVKPGMRIAQEEIFGPVLVMMPYEDEADAVAIANDSIYGLSGYVQSGSLERARRISRRLRTGHVHLNGARPDFTAPFGGYKQSGNGREWGVFGLEEFLEVKAVLGWGAD